MEETGWHCTRLRPLGDCFDLDKIRDSLRAEKKRQALSKYAGDAISSFAKDLEACKHIRLLYDTNIVIDFIVSIKWSGSSSKPAASPESELLPTEDVKQSPEERLTKESSSSQPSQQRLKQLFTDKDKGDGLAADINLRRKTNERLYSAVEAYWSSLSE